MMTVEMKAAVPVLPVRSTDCAAGFYRHKLAFNIDHVDDGYAVLCRDSIEIHLWAATDNRWEDRASGKPVVSGAETFLSGTASCRVFVSGIDQLCEEFYNAGVLHPNGVLTDKPYGFREFAILDLDGNLITFFENVPEIR